MVEQVWLTRAEAAEYLRVGTRTLDRWVAAGQLPAYRKGQRMTRFRREELDDFMMGRTDDSG